VDGESYYGSGSGDGAQDGEEDRKKGKERGKGFIRRARKSEINRLDEEKRVAWRARYRERNWGNNPDRRISLATREED